MKTAKLVEFCIRTRVIVEGDTDTEAIKIARNKVLNDPGGYVIGDNVVMVEKDDEVPYDPKFDKLT